jgi:hypothetical protein
MKKQVSLMIILIWCITGCKTPTESWLDSLSEFKQVDGKLCSMQIMKMDVKKDTTVLNYKVRIYPSKKWMSENEAQGMDLFSYRMDSCFYLQTGKLQRKPLFVMPVANGVKGSFEYLLSFGLDNSIKMRPLQLVYVDKYIDMDICTLDLNKD